MQKKPIGLAIVRTVVYIALFVMLDYLFMQQAIELFPSDLPAHLRPPDEGSYSALRVLYQILLGAFGNQGVCVLLALSEIGTLALTEYLIRKLAPTARPWAVFICALACNFAIAVYLPSIHSYYTVGSPGGNCWHNSTYTVMRLLALAALVFYLKFDGRIECTSKARSWALFTLMLTLATAVKPSFVITFGPAVFVLCLIDLGREGASSVKRSLLVGLALLVALVVVFVQLTILFPSDGSGEGGIAFGLAKVWRARHANIFVSFFQSLAFPLLVVACTRLRFWKDRSFLLAWLTVFFAMAEYVFLYETGERTYHGNFGWGLSFPMFYIFVISCAVFLDERGSRLRLAAPLKLGLAPALSSAGNAKAQASATGEKAVEDKLEQARYASTAAHPGMLDILTAFVFALHVGSGVWYFIGLMMGHSYY